MSGITFDAGGLIALDRHDRRIIILLARATERGMRITIPATALAQALRNPARQARLSRLMRQAGTALIPLDGPDATAVGLLLARSATADVMDAHVVVCAQRAGQAVVTSAPGDLRRIAPELPMLVLGGPPLKPGSSPRVSVPRAPSASSSNGSADSRPHAPDQSGNTPNCTDCVNPLRSPQTRC